MRTRVLSLLLSTAALAGLASCSTSNHEKLIGFDTDLARAVAAMLDVEVEFRETVWEQKEIELQSKQIDLIWNALTITDERREAFALSTPYMTNSQVIVAKKSFDGTIGKDNAYKVAYENGSAGEEAAAENELFSKCTKPGMDAQVNALMEVQAGTSDFAIIDSVMAGCYINSGTSYSDLKIIDSYNLTSEFYGIAGRKSDVGFMAKINEAIKAVYEAGETASWDAIAQKGKFTVGYTVFAPIAYFA